MSTETLTNPSESVTTPATGPGAKCWCGCGTQLPDGVYRNKKYVDDHRKVAHRKRQDPLTVEGQAVKFWARAGAARRGDAFGTRLRSRA